MTLPLTAPPAVPTWPALVMLMAFGEIEEGPLTGVLQVTDASGGLATARIHKRFGLYRAEQLDGDLIQICQHIPVYDQALDLIQPEWGSVANDGEHGTYRHAVERRELYEWRSSDFTQPLGPARAVTLLERPCWQVDLAPSEHKTSPLTITIDAATGMQLKVESRDFGTLHEWLEIEFVAELDDELFAWDGTVVSAHAYCDEDHDWVEDERREKKQAKKDKKWLRQSGLDRLRLRLEIRFEEFEIDRATGEFAASAEIEQWFTCGRRLPSDEPWEVTDSFDHEARWTAAGWQWRLRSDQKIAQRTLRHLRKQTRAATLGS